MRRYVAYCFPLAVVGMIVLLAYHQSSSHPFQPIDSDLYNRCPPGNACLAPHWVVNRLNHDITVIWDAKRERWVEDKKRNDPKGIVVHQGEVAYYQMQLVLPTPSADPDHIAAAVRAHAATRNHAP